MVVRYGVVFAGAGCALLTSVRGAVADELHVPGDFPTIQLAVDAAVNGDVVVIAPGTYPERIDLLGKEITIRGSGGPDVTTIDGAGPVDGSVFTCVNGETLNTVFEGLTITGGTGRTDRLFCDDRMPAGGGMFIGPGSSATVSDCIFINNTVSSARSTAGGAIFLHDGELTVTDCTFENNGAAFGGAIAVSCGPATLSVSGSTFSNNSAAFGGAMVVLSEGGAHQFADCSFTNNSASHGGGIFTAAALGGTVEIGDCLFTGNDGNGGAIRGSATQDGTLRISRCSVVGNHAFNSDDGAGLRLTVSTGGCIDVSECIIADNDSNDAWGGLQALTAEGGLIDVVNCLLTGNTAASEGGGIMAQTSSSGFIRIANCSVIANISGIFGGGLHSASDGGTIEVANCIVRDNLNSQITGSAAVTYSDVSGGFVGAGNIDADPLFVDPMNGDFHISPASPCIDAADNTRVPADTTTDLDGEPRFVDDPDTVDSGVGTPPIVDMGAYEFQRPCPPDLDGDGSVGIGDLLDLLAAWGPNPGHPADFDGDGLVGIADLLELLTGWGPCN